MMEELLGEEWYNLLKDEFSKDYMHSLSNFIQERRKVNKVYPEGKDVFNAFKLTPYSQVRVCIIGQDPYINKNEAHGLAFSTKQGTNTPSLEQISKAVENEVYDGLNLEWDNNLERWAKQGIFLLNSILTVDEGKSLSHQYRGWEQFTREVIKLLNDKGDVIFLLWGSYAKAYSNLIDTTKNVIISANHPVSASYNNEVWNSGNCFHWVNEIIKGDKIEW